jgi:hypothetical protein
MIESPFYIVLYSGIHIKSRTKKNKIRKNHQSARPGDLCQDAKNLRPQPGGENLGSCAKARPPNHQTMGNAVAGCQNLGI